MQRGSHRLTFHGRNLRDDEGCDGWMWGRKKDAEGDVTRRSYKWGMEGLEFRGFEVQDRLVERLDLGGG